MPTVPRHGQVDVHSLSSWQQMMTVLRNTGDSLEQLCSTECLGGLHSPVRMPYAIEQGIAGPAVEYLIFHFFKKVSRRREYNCVE